MNVHFLSLIVTMAKERVFFFRRVDDRLLPPNHAQKFLRSNNFEVVSLAAYFSNLVPGDYWLRPTMKGALSVTAVISNYLLRQREPWRRRRKSTWRSNDIFRVAVRNKKN